MPAGDASRVWFSEMIETLRSRWHEGMPTGDLIALRDELDAALQTIRRERNIRSPIITCRDCGVTAEAAAPHVSVRALIFSLARYGIASPEKTKLLDKAWASFRKQNGLDLYGKAVLAEGDHHSGCAHPV